MNDADQVDTSENGLNDWSQLSRAISGPRRFIELSDTFKISLSQELPVPPIVEGDLNARIDRLNLHQQLLLKTAAVIGNSFKLEMVLKSCPLSIDEEQMKRNLDELQKRFHMIRPVLSTTRSMQSFEAFPRGAAGAGAGSAGLGSLALSANNSAPAGKSLSLLKFTFTNAFLGDVLRRRLLSTQIKTIQLTFLKAKEEEDAKARKMFMEQYLRRPTQLLDIGKEGMLSVMKKKQSMLGAHWKERFVILNKDEGSTRLSYHQSKDDPIELYAVLLEGARTAIVKEDLPQATTGTVFVVHAKKFKKRGCLFNEPRSFYFRCSSNSVAESWVFTVKLFLEHMDKGAWQYVLSSRYVQLNWYFHIHTSLTISSHRKKNHASTRCCNNGSKSRR